MGPQAAAQESVARPLVWRGQPAGEAVARVLAAQAAVAQATLPHCLEDVDVEAVHDLRVAVRRARTVLARLGRVLPREERRELAANLRWTQSITSATRDLDTLLLRWGELVDAVPDDVRGHLVAVHDLLRDRRAATFETLATHLRSPTFAEGWTTWRDLVGSAAAGTGRQTAAQQPIEQLVAPRIEKAATRLRLASTAIDAYSPATALHDLRKQGKHLRYLLELFGEACLPSETVQERIRELKILQDDLGRHQDDAVHGDLLRSLRPALPTTAADPDGSACALDLLVEVVADDQLAARQRALQHLTDGS